MEEAPRATVDTIAFTSSVAAGEKLVSVMGSLNECKTATTRAMKAGMVTEVDVAPPEGREASSLIYPAAVAAA